MRHSTRLLTYAALGALWLTACSDGGDDRDPPAANSAPTANAGVNQSVSSGATVTLNGTASADSDGTIASYAWTQTAGTAITLTNPATSQPTFPAPQVVIASTLTFSLVVTDNRGAASTASTVSITVNPAAAGMSTVTGVVTFARVPFSAASPFGLDYANPVQQLARGVTVRAFPAGNTVTPLATGSTGDDGSYSLQVPGNTNIAIQVVAEMVRAAPLALPHWDMRVQSVLAGGTPFTYTHPTTFSSAAGAVRDVAIPLGLDAQGTPNAANRASGPFAILDSVYRGILTIRSAAPTTDFPPLILVWSDDGTFFSTAPAQHISLLNDLTADTDEYDQHVIAHEFGHYIEFNFSRADNIGGPHGLGDRLDPRVAFGEGFGYAFAAIVLNDPNARDSFVDTQAPIHRSGGFNIELNPTNPATGSDRNGCWCSESSVWSMLWDIYDNTPEANDTFELGFLPMWNVLIGEQRNTPAFTTIFSFITALKAQNPGNAGAINTLVAAQNIDAANINAFGSTETHFPAEVASIAALPIYTTATVGGPPVVLRNVNDAGHHNKLGNRRFIRFNVATARSVTISASSSNLNNPDVDFRVFRGREFVLSGEDPPTENPEVETFNAPAGEYLIDVYDCANGCSANEGTPGDYNLTVTIN